MRTKSITLLAVILLVTAESFSQDFYSVPSVDAPELAARGTYAVGARTEKIVNPSQIDILNFDKPTNKAPLYDRPLVLEIWYPATIPAGQAEQTTYAMPLPSGPPSQPTKNFNVAGKALRDAIPLTRKFPLVVISHGYPGSRYFLSYLGENLASKGFVVASIDHTDSVLGDIKPFPSTLLNRANDQLFTIDALEKLSRTQGHFLNGLIDDSRVAIIGYSMGGYGALASAGAGYSKKGWHKILCPVDIWKIGPPAMRITKAKCGAN